MNGEVEAKAVLLLAALVEQRIGMHHGSDGALFASKVRDHAEDQGFPSLLDYYYSLKYDDPRAERIDALVDAVVVGETYFFRELPGLARVIEVVRERAAEGSSTRIWCAACATGEEPLTLAALAAEAGLLDHVQLLASDVSPRHLGRARAGRYSRRALRSRPEGMPPWIRPEGDLVVVDPRLRAAVRWERVNLVDDEAARALGAFDVILCRNVLIYFADATARRVVERLTRGLAPGGVLLVGASESLLRLGTGLECFERGGVFLYRRSEP